MPDNPRAVPIYIFDGQRGEEIMGHVFLLLGVMLVLSLFLLPILETLSQAIPYLP